MNKRNVTFSFITLIALLTITAKLVIPNTLLAAGPTTNPWPSWRHDLSNTAAAPDSGYPSTDTILWSVYRSDRPDDPGTPAAAGGPLVVDKGMVFTTGKGIVQTNNQFDGSLNWSKAFPYEITWSEPPGVPADWCYGDVPTLAAGNTGKCYVANMVDCPSWCFECTTDQPDCSSLSVINPLAMPVGYAQFIAGPTLDTVYGTHGAVIFGTFDGRVISLDMSDGTTLWESTPFKDAGGPNDGAPWYNQKFAWHLSPPSIANGNVYIGTFLPSFYYIFRYNAFGTPKWGHEFQTYWAGHDGWFYALDESDGSINWTWDPQGCGVANIPPVDSSGAVYVTDDFHTNFCQGLFSRLDSSNGVSDWTFGPVPVAQGGSPSISGNIIFYPASDGVLWAIDKDTGALKWTFHGGFNPKGHSGLTSAPAVDEANGWVLGASDSGHMFAVDKDTGQLVSEAYLGVPDWNPGDPHPSSGFWFAGTSAMAIVPSQTLLYIAGTDYDRAWQGQFTKGKEKLFCYDYGSGPEMILLWEYQFCSDDDVCADLDSQHILRGWEEYTSSFYTVPSPALADGHVYYNSYNGKVYCFGSAFPTGDTDLDGEIDYSDNCPAIPNGPNGGTCISGSIGAPCTSPGENTGECGTGGFCSMAQEDADGDLVGDACDSCTDTDDFDNICLGDICPGAFDPNQKDTYPPQGNGIGDACDCEGDFNCDGNVDATDVTSFLTDFGRNQFFNPCDDLSSCNGDFNCEGNVDAMDVKIFLEDFGRNTFNNPCPACVVGGWCVY